MTTEFEAYLEVVRWLVWRDIGHRRAGTLGHAAAFVGTDSSGAPIELRRAGDQWRLVYATGRTEDVEGADLIGRAGKESIRLTHAVIEHDLPDLLFHSAVKAARESLVEAEQAEGGPAIEDDENDLEEEESDEESEAVFDFIMTTSAQDAAVRSSITAIVLAVAAAEAQVNRWTAARGGWTATEAEDEDKFDLVRKCKALANRMNVRLDIGRRPYQDLREVVKRRNDLVHSKPEEHLVPLIGSGTIPGRGLSVEARRSCKVVRDSMVAMARAISEQPPRYLANCPPTPPDDDDAWRMAIISTGMRDDPDFPKVADAATEE